MTATLDGPRLSPRSGRARSLVVILHGYGADGHDLIEVGRIWQAALPDAAFVAPHAPEPCADAPDGFQWFPLTTRDLQERWRGVNHAAPGLDAFLDQELARHGLDDSRLALVGFSQGCMMALHVGLRRPRPPAAIVGLSGLLVVEPGRGPEGLAELARSRPPILLVHGDRDGVIPVDALHGSLAMLDAVGIACESHVSVGVDHTIDQDALRLGARFLARALQEPA